MPDMMAIVSKAVFEKQAGKAPTVGTRLQMDRYVSANKNLEPLAEGGRLYLVTVRPPDEALWLVAVLENPEHDGEAWVAEACQTPIVDISKLRSKIKFESGVGITAKKGALGMSLQTPRALTEADAALLDAAAGTAGGDDDEADDDDDDARPKKKPAAKGKPLPPPPKAPLKQSGVRSGNLIDGIVAEPDNVDLKRVYADLLVEKGDPRGDFILLEIALDGPLSIRKREQLRGKQEILAKEHGAKWWPYKLASKRVEHGFLRAVGGDLKQLRAAATAGLFEKEPVTELTISVDDTAELEKLVKEPWLPQLRRLVIRGEIGDDGFAVLRDSEALSWLRALNVTNCGITSEGLGGMHAALPSMTNFVLTSNPIGDEGLANLREWAALPNIEVLYLSGCELSADGIRDFLHDFEFPKLWKLTLADNELEDDVAGAITKAAANLPALQVLELKSTGISDTGVKALGKSKLASLKRLDVRKNDIDSALAEKDARVRV